MARIEGIKINNYRVLRDVTLGRMWWYLTVPTALTPMTAVIGKNGVGKSSLFDAFGFLADCLKLGVEEACDQRGRGGFDRIRSRVRGLLPGRARGAAYYLYARHRQGWLGASLRPIRKPSPVER